jgi:hypothetical protein
MSKEIPKYQGETQYPTYATTRDAVIQHVQKTYKGGLDIAKSIEDMTVIYLNAEEPRQIISLETDPTNRVMIQAGLDIKSRRPQTTS